MPEEYLDYLLLVGDIGRRMKYNIHVNVIYRSRENNYLIKFWVFGYKNNVYFYKYIVRRSVSKLKEKKLKDLFLRFPMYPRLSKDPITVEELDSKIFEVTIEEFCNGFRCERPH